MNKPEIVKVEAFQVGGSLYLSEEKAQEAVERQTRDMVRDELMKLFSSDPRNIHTANTIMLHFEEVIRLLNFWKGSQNDAKSL